MHPVLRPLAVAFGALLASSAGAVVLRVPSEYPTIQAGLDASAAGDTVLVAPGTYTDYTQRLFQGVPRHACAFLVDGVTLLSESGPEVTTIDMGKAAVFQADVIYGDLLLSGQTVVAGFTVTGVVDGRPGVLVDDSEKVTFRNCIIRDMNGVAGTGGFSARLSDADILGCEFRDLSTATGTAAGLTQTEADLLVDGCTFTNCVGRGIGLQGVNQFVPEQAVIRNSVFINNSAPGSGGAGAVNINGYEGPVTITDCYFEGNVAVFAGGAVSVGGGTAVGTSSAWTVQNCTFWRNQATAGGSTGGALFAGTLTGTGAVIGCTFEGNAAFSALGGSSVYLDVGPVVFSNNVVTGSIGGAAVRRDVGGVTRGCNIYWQNTGGNTTGFGLSATDEVINPLFCDPTGGDFHVAENSACLPENNLHLCGAIGVLGAQCASTGTVVSGIFTVPAGITIDVDSVSSEAPSLFNWIPATMHVVSVPDTDEVAPGYAFQFTGWDDGATELQRVVAASNTPQVYTARYDSLYVLTMNVGAGGTVVPPTSWHPPRSVVAITAIPDSGWFFTGWVGQGWGSYNGPDSSATVTLMMPLIQTASFNKNETVVIDTSPSGRRVTVDGQSLLAPVTFAWPRGSMHTVSLDSIQVDDTTRYLFEKWSDYGPRTRTLTVPANPLTITAEFATEYDLSFHVSGSGTVTPAPGWVQSGSAVTLEALPDPYYVFAAWTGTGSGSYTGTANPVTIDMGGPIHEVADFQRIAHEVSLSLSDVDPGVTNGVPLGFGSVYLWHVCSTAGSLSFLEADLAGSIAPLGFAPAPGVLNGGDASRLKLSLPCAGAPALLGSFVVSDPTGGDLCLVPAADTGALQGLDCTSRAYVWPTDLKITGIRTDGGAPCSSGRACSEDEEHPVAAGPLPENRPTETLLEPNRPNPFSGETEIRFALAAAGRVDLSIYDVQGRLVRRLEHREMPAGFHSVVWNGRDAVGGRVPAGVYFTRLVAGDLQQAQRIVLLGAK